LVKEEVKHLPYYATMNVRSFENKEVSFKATNIPQEYTVRIVDGEEIIDLSEGKIYKTTVSAGENAERFKVLIQKIVRLTDLVNKDIEITNSNRHVSVSSTQADLRIEVFNALGQKVYETKEHNFILNEASAGVYMIKAYNNKASKTAKIVIQ
jgi:hypothetical protein